MKIHTSFIFTGILMICLSLFVNEFVVLNFEYGNVFTFDQPKLGLTIGSFYLLLSLTSFFARKQLNRKIAFAGLLLISLSISCYLITGIISLVEIADTLGFRMTYILFQLSHYLFCLGLGLIFMNIIFKSIKLKRIKGSC